MKLFDGIKLFNDAMFFEAHDYFENLWRNENGNDKDLYLALTQISVGHYHLSSGNLSGALSQLKKGLKKLLNYSDDIYQINLSLFRRDINYLIKQITVFYSKKNYTFEVVNISFF